MDVPLAPHRYYQLLVHLCSIQRHASLEDAIISIFKNAYAIRVGGIYWQSIAKIIKDIVCCNDASIDREWPITDDCIQAAHRSVYRRGIITSDDAGWLTLHPEWKKLCDVQLLTAQEIKTMSANMVQKIKQKISGQEENRQQKKAYVYYLSWGLNLNHVKIGYSVNLVGRFKAYLTHNSDILHVWRVQEVKGPSCEKQLHDKFAEYRLTGEWFKHEAILKEYIQGLPLETGAAIQDTLHQRILIHCS